MKMNSTVAYKTYLKIKNPDFIIEKPLNLKHSVISFSKICTSKNPCYIYSGNEKVAFGERHPIYQKIFKKEFTEMKS